MPDQKICTVRSSWVKSKKTPVTACAKQEDVFSLVKRAEKYEISKVLSLLFSRHSIR